MALRIHDAEQPRRSFRDVTAQSGLDQNNTRYSFCCAGAITTRWMARPYVVNDFGRKNLTVTMAMNLYGWWLRSRC